MTLDAVYQHFRESWVPVARELPKTVTAYQHIEYVGAGSVNRISEMTFAGAVSDSYRAWFNGGVASDEVPEPLRSRVGDNRLFVPNVRNPARVQLPINHEPEIEQLAAAVGVAELVPELRQVFALQGSTPPQQVHLEFQERVPELGEMIETWDTSDLKCLTLTTVGIAIGHAYWRRVIPGHGAPLATWIAE